MTYGITLWSHLPKWGKDVGGEEVLRQPLSQCYCTGILHMSIIKTLHVNLSWEVFTCVFVSCLLPKLPSPDSCASSVWLKPFLNKSQLCFLLIRSEIPSYVKVKNSHSTWTEVSELFRLPRGRWQHWAVSPTPTAPRKPEVPSYQSWAKDLDGWLFQRKDDFYDWESVFNKKIGPRCWEYVCSCKDEFWLRGTEGETLSTCSQGEEIHKWQRVKFLQTWTKTETKVWWFFILPAYLK